MRKARIIAHLEVKGDNVVKGIRMEGLRRVGRPQDLSLHYFENGIDEIIFNDIVASLYGRNQLADLVSEAAARIFVPLCVGGGVRSVDDFRLLLRAGADKIAVNTQLHKTPELITKAASMFGSQCVVAHIQAKYRKEGYWEAYSENGRERTRKDAVKWAAKLESLGAGEILITSVDRDGMRKGLDHAFIAEVASSVSIPVIASGGTANAQDIATAVLEGGANACAVGNLFHFNVETVSGLKEQLRSLGVQTRRTEG